MTWKAPAIASLALAMLTLWPNAALAHPMPGVGDFYAGMLHPVMTMDFLLPLIALGLLAGQQPRKSALAMLIAVPSGLLAGAGIARIAPMSASIASINLLWMVLLGVLVAWAPRVPPGLIVTMAIIPALTIGWANGTELDTQVSAARFIPGLAVSPLMLVTYGAGGVRRLRAPWMQIAVRVIGSWIAAVGILVGNLR